MVAVTLTEAGAPNFFQNLYPLDNKTLSGFISRNLINLLAMGGLLLQALVLANATGNIMLGLVTGLITVAITFPIAQEVLPVFIREGDRWFRTLQIGGRPVAYPGNWHKYFLGLVFTVFLVLLEYLLLTVAVPSLMVAGRRSSN